MSLEVHRETRLEQQVGVYGRSVREESVKRVYATTQRRVIHIKLSSEMIPVKRCQESDVGQHASTYAPNAHALSFRNSGDVCNVRSMFQQRKRGQPGEKAPARECGGGGSRSAVTH